MKYLVPAIGAGLFIAACVTPLKAETVGSDRCFDQDDNGVWNCEVVFSETEHQPAATIHYFERWNEEISASCRYWHYPFSVEVPSMGCDEPGLEITEDDSEWSLEDSQG